MRLTDFTEPMLRNRKECTWLEDAESFSKETATVRHIHRDVLGVSAIEYFTFLRESLTVPVSEFNQIVHPDKRTQSVPGLYEGTRNVDPIHMTPKPFGQVSCRATNSTAYVDETVTLFDRQGICKVDGRQKSPCVEMINRRKVLDGRGLGVDPSQFHCFQDSRKDVALAPVVGNRLSIVHVKPSKLTKSE